MVKLKQYAIISLMMAFSFKFLHAPSAAGDSLDPNAKAESIARASPKVMAHLKTLVSEAKRIKNREMREDALAILDHPKFQVIEERRSSESEIRKTLLAAGLLDEKYKDGPLFPPQQPMAFVAAPASPWRIHHAFPGGLVYHTLTNMKIALSIAKVYKEVYGIHLDEDILRLAPIWHDVAKTITVPWNADGSAQSDEGMIAGTPRHHVLGVAEAAYRNYPPPFIITLASAHNPPNPGAGLSDLIKYLKAAAIIAGKSFQSVGLKEDGSGLASPAPLESFVHHLSDHDWVGTQVSMAQMPGILSDMGYKDLWEQDKILSLHGDMELYQIYLTGGKEELSKVLESHSKK